MPRKVLALAVIPALLLAGCVDGDDFGGFGGSGGSNGFGGAGGSGGSSAGISLARDVCLNTARAQRLTVARVDSVREYGFANGTARGVELRMQIRRDPMSLNLEPRVCRFSYSSGQADISRT